LLFIFQIKDLLLDLLFLLEGELFVDFLSFPGEGCSRSGSHDGVDLTLHIGKLLELKGLLSLLYFLVLLVPVFFLLLLELLQVVLHVVFGLFSLQLQSASIPIYRVEAVFNLRSAVVLSGYLHLNLNKLLTS